jgi:hypothetical protein
MWSIRNWAFVGAMLGLITSWSHIKPSDSIEHLWIELGSQALGFAGLFALVAYIGSRIWPRRLARHELVLTDNHSSTTGRSPGPRHPTATYNQRGRMGRTIAIWVFGLLASAMVGGMIATRLAPPYAHDWDVWGAFAGIFTFICLRLWLAGPSAKPPAAQG